MQRFDLPATRDELVRQILEQHGMRGGIAANAKVACRLHEALAEMMVPNPVDHDSSQKRSTATFRIGDPSGQGATLLAKTANDPAVVARLVDAALGVVPARVPAATPIYAT